MNKTNSTTRRKCFVYKSLLNWGAINMGQSATKLIGFVLFFFFFIFSLIERNNVQLNAAVSVPFKCIMHAHFDKRQNKKIEQSNDSIKLANVLINYFFVAIYKFLSLCFGIILKTNAIIYLSSKLWWSVFLSFLLVTLFVRLVVTLILSCDLFVFFFSFYIIWFN